MQAPRSSLGKRSRFAFGASNSGRSAKRFKANPKFITPYSTRATEKKASDIAPATYQVNTTGSITALHTPTPGTDITNRVGRKTLMTSVYIRGRVQLEAATTVATPITVPAQQCRMLLVYDRQPNGNGNPTIADILNVADPTSHLNLNGRDRFLVLKDKNFSFDPFVTTAANASNDWNHTVQHFKVFKKLRLETIFNSGTTGVSADVQTGNLLMVWIGSAAAGVNLDSNFIGSTRVRFEDA